LTSKKEQFYIQRISELEAQLRQRDERIAALEKQVAELSKVNAELVGISKMNKLCIEMPVPPKNLIQWEYEIQNR
jgi:uncharacterized coiled-coil protein SlyX